MTKITCDMCMDLIPLVQDGAASEDSKNAVIEHIKCCPQCKALYEEQPPIENKSLNAYKKTKSKIQTFLAMLTFFGMFFGMSLLVNEGLLYIIFILPVIGVCSYLLWGWKSLWKMPLLLSILFISAHTINLFQGIAFDFIGILVYLILITAFADIGTLIAGLLHFAFRKENIK